MKKYIYKVALFSLTFCLFTFQEVFGQWPSSDVLFCRVQWNQKDILIDQPKLLNGFNIGNYNNQPYFIDYNQLFLTVGLQNEATDIYHFDIDKEEYFAFTKTIKQSEFSPQLTPDKKSVSVVRVEEDGKTQTLWSYPLNQSNFGKNLLPSVTNVGYHVWLDSVKLALFLVDSIPKLAITNIDKKSVVIIQENIGRCLKNKNGHLFFTTKNKDNRHEVKKYNMEEQTIHRVFVLPEECEDFEVLNNGNIIFGDQANLMLSPVSNPAIWSTLFDLSEYGIKKINRLVSERDRIVLVVEKL
ncbi:MAG: hypothetical protein WAT79_01560 [Saprospiraceae bacterium]